jgi:hypothetical protein
MSRFTIEYNPSELTDDIKKIIRNEVSPSMVSIDELSCQYDITMVEDCLLEIEEQELEEVFIKDNLNYIKQLISEGVAYIEF